MFTNIGKLIFVRKIIDEHTARFNAKLNDVKMADALEYLERLRKYCWAYPAALWALTTIIILSGAVTNLNWAILAVILHLINMVDLIASVEINQYIYNVSTRRSDLDPQARTKELWRVRRRGMIQPIIVGGASGSLLIAFCAVPYMEFLRLNPTATGWTTGTFDKVIGSPLLMRLIMLSLPIVSSILQYRKLVAEEEMYKDVINRSITTKRYHDPSLHNLLTGYHQKKVELPEAKEEEEVSEKFVEPEPYVAIGKSIRTEETVELAPVQRKQNCIYFGPVGSGKTSTIFIPQIKQDIDHYLRFVRDFSRLANSDGFMIKKNNPATHYLNGLAVVETSNDLCQSVYNLAKKMGVPDEKIMWFDPSNPATPSLNLLRGPVPSVTENVSNIINGVKTENSDFFQESERTHLKMYITLLKMSAVVERKTPDFSDLMDLYNDVYLVLQKMEYLRQYIAILKTNVEDCEKVMKDNPDDINARTEFNEMRDKYKVASDCYKWFTNSIKPKMFGQGMLKHKAGDHVGWIIYEDINDQNIAGLRNTLNDLAQNSLLRRILFRESGDFSIDDFLYNGGIMLCNTAKTELQDSLSKTVGQVYMICLATAAFRRKPDTAPMFTIYADEFPDFIYSNFTSFLAQARKYNISIVIAAQTFAQIARDYGQEFAETVMSNMLTRGAFGDLSPGDAKRLEPFFGESYRTTEEVNSQDIDVLAGNETNKRSVSSKSGFEPNITASELMQLQKFNIAVRHPDMQGSEMFDVIKTKFLTDDDILKDPNIFDMHNERDEEAYETMLDHQHHGNPDLDPVDEEIVKKISEGKIKIAPPNINKYVNPDSKEGSPSAPKNNKPKGNAGSFVDVDDDDPDPDPGNDNSDPKEDDKGNPPEGEKNDGAGQQGTSGSSSDNPLFGGETGGNDGGDGPSAISKVRGLMGDIADTQQKDENDALTNSTNKASGGNNRTSTNGASEEEEPFGGDGSHVPGVQDENPEKMDESSDSSSDLEETEPLGSTEGGKPSDENEASEPPLIMPDYSKKPKETNVIAEQANSLAQRYSFKQTDELSNAIKNTAQQIAGRIDFDKGDIKSGKQNLESLEEFSSALQISLLPLAQEAVDAKVSILKAKGKKIDDSEAGRQKMAKGWVERVIEKSGLNSDIADTKEKVKSAEADEKRVESEFEEEFFKRFKD